MKALILATGLLGVTLLTGCVTTAQLILIAPIPSALYRRRYYKSKRVDYLGYV